MRYQDSMMDAARTLTSNGYIVLMPFVAYYSGNKPTDELKEMLDDMHFTKISMAEAIYVVGTHRGESTIKEIQYAKDHGIEVRNW